MRREVSRAELLAMTLPERHEVMRAHLSRRGLLRGAAVLGAASAAGPLLWTGRAVAADGATVPVTARWLSYGADPQREMSVSWQVPTPVSNPQLRYGPHGSLDATVPAELRVAKAMAGVAGPSQQYYVSARLSGLTPGTTYTYQAVHTGGGAEVSTFTTAPAARERFRFTACGDQGPTPSAVAVDAQVARLRPAFHLLAGDISYAEPSGAGLSTTDFIPDRWTNYLSQTDPVASQRPWMFTPGNHEIEPVYGADGYDGFRSRFSLPQNGPQAATGVYSFRYSNVGVVSLDANEVTLEIAAKRNYTRGAQTAWLAKTLAALRGDPEVDFIVVFFHQCAYATDIAHGSDGGVRAAWVPIFDRYAVDLVVNGHNHTCERTDPLRGGAVTRPAPIGSTIHPATDGTTYVVVGGGGIGLTKFKAPDSYETHVDTADVEVTSTLWSTPGDAVPERVTWSRARYTGYSFLSVDVDPGPPGKLATMQVRLLDASGRELDTVTLSRPNKGSAPRNIWLPATVGVGALVVAGGATALAVHHHRRGEPPPDYAEPLPEEPAAPPA